MAIRNIVQEGDPILAKKCRQVTDFNERLHILLDDMHDTLKKADGAGLAAPQVGMLKALALVMVDDGSYLEIMASLKRLGQLEGNDHVCPGHDITSTLDRERKWNPYLTQALRG